MKSYLKDSRRAALITQITMHLLAIVASALALIQFSGASPAAPICAGCPDSLVVDGVTQLLTGIESQITAESTVRCL